MTTLRRAAYRDLKKVTEASGFVWVRRSGSHNTFRDAAGHIVVINDKGNDPLSAGLITKIIRQMGITADEYHRKLDEL